MLEVAERIKSHFRNMDPSGSGLISREKLSWTLCDLGMSCDNVEHLFRMTSFVNRSGDVVYSTFVDWLTGNIPEDAYAKKESAWSRSLNWADDAAKDAGLRSLCRAKRRLQEGARGAVNLPAELEAFLRAAAPAADAKERMRAAWAAAAGNESGQLPSSHLVELASADAGLWAQFAQRCIEQLLLEVFRIVDLDRDGRLSAEELMTFLMLITVQKEARFALSPADAECIVQEFDAAGDGVLSKAAFLDMVHMLEREGALGLERMTPTASPHLLLYFDVNNTVLVADTLTGSGAEDLISMTLAGCAWGIKTQRSDGEDMWVLVCPEPVVTQPWRGLVSYTEYVVGAYPMPLLGTSDEVEAVKEMRRKTLQSFCARGHPGQALRPHLVKLLDALRHECKLLPSFFYLLQELKRAGRSFSVVFRTFGVDVDAEFEHEFNTFCAGRHPLFPGGVVLDGSDGLEDHRMNLSDHSSIGTFVRTGDDKEVVLVWGTHKQPPKGHGTEFYRDVPGARLVVGTAEVAASLHQRVCSQGGTVVLRDFYAGWAKAKFSSRGGKPLFLRIEDDSVLPIFFDDHIRPMDPNIVDAIDVRDFPKRVPMAQVYDIHLVRAAPLLSITELSYFWDQLLRCECAKAAQLARRRKVASMLHDAAAVREVLRLLQGEDKQVAPSGTSSRQRSKTSRNGSKTSPAMLYTPWQEMEAVKHAPPFVGIS